jgi:predicted amidophosphoribosyltransferase
VALVARRLRERAPSLIDELFGEDVTLVPVPRSALMVPGALWPAHEIAKSLDAKNFGAGVLRCLTRKVAVPKAATSRKEERPKARAHFESLDLVSPLSLPSRIMLVDDVITRGAQLFGAAWKIWSVRPDIDVRAFAVIRTISAPEDFVSIADPCVGRIEKRGEECYRSP